MNSLIAVEELRRLIVRDCPAASLLFGVETNGELILDYSQSANIEEEAFFDFADDTRRAAAESWVNAERSPALGAQPETRGCWEKYQEPNIWVHVLHEEGRQQ